MIFRSQVMRFYDEIWNRSDLTVIPLVLHPAVTFRGSLGTVRRGHAEFADYVRSVTGALSSYNCEIRQLVVEGDIAVARMMFSGQHTGEFLGRAPTGRNGLVGRRSVLHVRTSPGPRPLGAR